MEDEHHGGPRQNGVKKGQELPKHLPAGFLFGHFLPGLRSYFILRSSGGHGSNSKNQLATGKKQISSPGFITLKAKSLFFLC